MPSSARCRRQRTRPPAPAHTKIPSAHSMPEPAPHISIPSAAQHGDSRYGCRARSCADGWVDVLVLGGDVGGDDALGGEQVAAHDVDAQQV